MALDVKAWGKLNLSLEVLGRRPDGFHEVATVMQSISLSDDLTLEPADGLTLECGDPSLAGGDNLVMKAALALKARTGTPLGARITLRKGLPAAAGLGGASADAAATLVGLAALWRVDLSREQMAALAAELGSDVPFFLGGGTALATGRGELLRQLRDGPVRWFVVLVPEHDIQGKTAALYRRLTVEDWSGGQRTHRLADAIDRGLPWGEDSLGNCFEPAAERVFPTLAGCGAALRNAGGWQTHLSGAGPALFSLHRSRDEAEGVAIHLAEMGYTPYLLQSLSSAAARPTPVPAVQGPGGPLPAPPIN